MYSNVSEHKDLPNQARQDAALAELNKAIKSRDRKAKAAPLGVVAMTLAVLALVIGGIWFAATYQPTSDTDTSAAATTTPEIDIAAMPTAPLEAYEKTITCEYPEDTTGEAAKQVDVPSGKDVTTTGTETVTIKTGDGDIPVTLDNSLSPCTTNSFKHLAEAGYYDDTICHRVVKSDSMTIVQCGDPLGEGTGGPGFTFADEFPLNGVAEAEQGNPVNYKRGTLAMANSGPDTNGSQFFLVVEDTTLPPAYNVFGTISEEGLKTLDTIIDTKATETSQEPTEEITISEVTVG